jgi:branched-chain amino acid transport system ATP-binding protein
MTLLEVSGLRKRFGGLLAVGSLDLSMAQGEMLGMIGPNGAGKTTVFNLLSGFLASDSGEIRFRGRRLHGLKPHEICRLGLARTFQIVRPFPQLSVVENVRIAALSRHPAMREALDAARAVVERVGLGARQREPAAGLTADRSGSAGSRARH